MFLVSRSIAMNSSVLSKEEYDEASDAAFQHFVEMGFLDYEEQESAFRNLVWKFVHAAAESDGKQPYQLTAETIRSLVNDFMIEYEQRLWPGDSHHPVRSAHLNNPNGDGDPDLQHTETEVVGQYKVEGRYAMSLTERQKWRVEHGVEPTQNDLRWNSNLAALLRQYFNFVKCENEPRCTLTQEQLLACVLAGEEYVGGGTAMTGVPEY